MKGNKVFKIKIREANVNDVKQIIKLWKETGLYFVPFDEERRLSKLIKKKPELLLIAEDENKVVGTVIGNYSWRVSIDHLAVDKNYRKKGIGRELLENIKRALKAKGATVALIDSNLLREFWEHLGLRYRGIYSNYTIEL